jgi:hypothetical protein
MKLIVVERVLEKEMVVEGADECATVAGGIGDEKTVIFGGISPIFEFFLLPESAGDCDVATKMGEPFPRFRDVLASVCEPVVTSETGGGAGTDIGVGWGPFSMVLTSLVLITFCFNHFLRNKTSIVAQLFLSSSGNSSNHSSASLLA